MLHYSLQPGDILSYPRTLPFSSSFCYGNRPGPLKSRPIAPYIICVPTYFRITSPSRVQLPLETPMPFTCSWYTHCRWSTKPVSRNPWELSRASSPNDSHLGLLYCSGNGQVLLVDWTMLHNSVVWSSLSAGWTSTQYIVVLVTIWREETLVT